MTKQVKDLTYYERIKLCNKQESCAKCPLYMGGGVCLNTITRSGKILIPNRNRLGIAMNTEVEIDD